MNRAEAILIPALAAAGTIMAILWAQLAAVLLGAPQ